MDPSGGQSFPRSLPEIIPLPKGVGFRQLPGVKNWVRGTTSTRYIFNVSVLQREGMLDESSPNGPHQGSPSSAPAQRNGHFRAAGLKAGLIWAHRHWGTLQEAQQPSCPQGGSLHGSSPDTDPTWGFLPSAKDFRANSNAPMVTPLVITPNSA